MTTSIHGARLVTGVDDEPLEGASIRIEGERFAEVARGDVAPGEVAMDGAGLTFLPGLVNAHAHLAGAALFEADAMPPAVVAAWLFEHLRRSLDLGFTTVREVGGADGGVKEALRLGLVRGPRLLTAGPLLVQMGGHGEFRPAFGGDPHVHHAGTPGLCVFTQPVAGPDAMRAAARLAFKRGADFVKLCISGGVTSLADSLGDTQLSADEMRAAVEEAEARGTYVTGHAHNNKAIAMGLEAGLACFEHGTALDEETAARMAQAGAALVTTLTVCHVYADNAGFLPPEILSRIDGVEEGQRTAIRIAEEHGVLLGCGADLIGPDQRRYGLEVALTAEVVGAMRAIQIATIGNARVLRVADRVGSVEAGKLADVIAVDGDPLADPSLLDDPANVVLVIKDGVVEKDPHDLAGRKR